MNIKEITVSAGLKLSKNYNVSDSQVSIKAEVDHDNYLSEYEELSKIVHGLVDSEVSEGIKKLNEPEKIINQ